MSDGTQCSYLQHEWRINFYNPNKIKANTVFVMATEIKKMNE